MKCEFIILNEIERNRQLLEERIQQPIYNQNKLKKRNNKKKFKVIKAKKE